MNSVYSSWLYILILIYVICIYYSEIDEPNSYIDKNNSLVSGIKWGALFFLVVGELSMAYALDNSKEDSEPQNIKILFAVMITWFLLFTPSIYFYYSGELTNGFYGKPSIYINSIFENIIGYLFVKTEANQIFSDLNIGKFEDDGKTIKDMEKIMIEINKSRAIFINQLNIFNFKNIWDKLFSPLFSQLHPGKTSSQGISDSTKVLKENVGEGPEEVEGKIVGGAGDENKSDVNSNNSTEHSGSNDSLEQIREKLFNLVKRKYIIGKCLWFLYNCIMCLSISLYLVVI
jgi:hypothetical protein